MTDLAQTMERLLAEERELQFSTFDNDAAWRLGSLLRQRARAGAKPIAIDITRGGQQLFHSALPGAVPDNTAWIRRKSAVVVRFHHSSLYMRYQCESRGTTLAARYGLDEAEYAASGGSFPLILRGTGCIGAVTVSGLPQVEDHDVVVAGLREFLASGPV